VVAFDEAVQVCLDFAARVPDTLLIITTDHATGNPGLNGTGSAYQKSASLFGSIANARRSFESLEPGLSRKPAAVEIQKLIAEATGHRIATAKAEQLARFLDGHSAPMYDSMKSLPAQLGQAMGNHYGVGWTGTDHTSDYVPLLAIGPGAGRFAGFVPTHTCFISTSSWRGLTSATPRFRSWPVWVPKRLKWNVGPPERSSPSGAILWWYWWGFCALDVRSDAIRRQEYLWAVFIFVFPFLNPFSLLLSCVPTGPAGGARPSSCPAHTTVGGSGTRRSGFITSTRHIIIRTSATSISSKGNWPRPRPPTTPPSNANRMTSIPWRTWDNASSARARG